MIDAPEVNDVRVTAQAFFDEMKEWEDWSATLDHGSDTNEQRLARLQAIFTKYLSAKALAHPQSRYGLLNFGTPPAFRQPIVKVEEPKNNQAWVYVPRGAIGGHARYFWKREDDAWKVEYLETDIANKGSWKKYLDI